MKEIENRKDINTLVIKFYAKIRKDELLGPIFTSHIPNDKWAPHLEKLTDFWVMRLFGVDVFKGNPAQKHVNVDRGLNHTMDRKHFEAWLKLWFETIDELYIGGRATRAKDLASQMANGQLRVVVNNRPQK